MLDPDVEQMYPRSLSVSHRLPINITYVIIANVFLGLATLAVGIRLWSRKIQRQSLLLNDYTAILGWVETMIRTASSTTD